MMSAFNILAAGYSQRQLLNVPIIMCYLVPRLGLATTANILTHVKHLKCVCWPTLRLGQLKHKGKQDCVLHFWHKSDRYPWAFWHLNSYVCVFMKKGWWYDLTDRRKTFIKNCSDLLIRTISVFIKNKTYTWLYIHWNLEFDPRVPRISQRRHCMATICLTVAFPCGMDLFPVLVCYRIRKMPVKPKVEK